LERVASFLERETGNLLVSRFAVREGLNYKERGIVARAQPISPFDYLPLDGGYQLSRT